MKYIIASFFFIALVVGCSKGKFETKPDLRLLSTSGLVVPKPGPGETSGLQFVLEYTDKEGDVSDSLIIIRQRTNVRPIACTGGVCTVGDSVKYKIPTFPDHSRGQFEVNFTYSQLRSAVTPNSIPGTSNPVLYEADSLVYKFVARDKAGNKSDTLVVPGVVIQR